MSKSAFRQRVGLILLVAARCAPQAAVGLAAAIMLIARDVWTPGGGARTRAGKGDDAGRDRDAS